MMRSITSRVLVLTAVAACTVIFLPEVAFSRGGGGGGKSGGSSRSTSRSGPASSGSTKKSRAKAADRGGKKSDSSKGKDKDKTDKSGRGSKKTQKSRWNRRRGGRRVAVADWGDLDCTKSERVDGVTYHYCDGTWWEKVMDGGEAVWVEVENPG